VLVVDEYPRYAETLARLVTSEAYAIRLGSTCPSLREALIQEATWAQAVVCDMSNPSVEKVAMAAQLRRRRPDLIWVICTSTPNHPAVRTMVRLGHVMVEKPYTSREVRLALGRSVCRKSGFDMPAVRVPRAQSFNWVG